MKLSLFLVICGVLTVAAKSGSKSSSGSGGSGSDEFSCYECEADIGDNSDDASNCRKGTVSEIETETCSSEVCYIHKYIQDGDTYKKRACAPEFTDSLTLSEMCVAYEEQVCDVLSADATKCSVDCCQKSLCNSGYAMSAMIGVMLPAVLVAFLARH